LLIVFMYVTPPLHYGDSGRNLKKFREKWQSPIPGTIPPGVNRVPGNEPEAQNSTSQEK
jgi:hypothetical protein